MQPNTKTGDALSLYQSGEFIKALAIFKTFRMQFSKDQKRYMQIAHECLTNKGRAGFYTQLGTDVNQCILEANNAILSTYRSLKSDIIQIESYYLP